jgi:hypothetical protein
MGFLTGIPMPRSFVKFLQCMLVSMVATAGFILPARSEVRTLTDQLGRTIKVEIIAVTTDTVTIKREDGQKFDMPLANLSDDDQAALRAWTKKNPDSAMPEVPTIKTVPSPKSVTMTLSRGKFDVDVTYKSEYSKESYEGWGYNVQLTNTTLAPLENLRVDYNIFGRLYSSSSQTRESGSNTVETLAAKKSVTFRTKSFRLSKWKAHDGSYNSNGTLTGVWVRLYAGDTLLQEYASPESLKTAEKWTVSRD